MFMEPDREGQSLTRGGRHRGERSRPHPALRARPRGDRRRPRRVRGTRADGPPTKPEPQLVSTAGPETAAELGRGQKEGTQAALPGTWAGTVATEAQCRPVHTRQQVTQGREGRLCGNTCAGSAPVRLLQAGALGPRTAPCSGAKC